MGITDYIKTRLLNNRVEQYNTKRSYWGENERQPRTDGINTGLDLPDALLPVINKTIANARYAVKLDGYTSGILKNRIDKANVNIVLVDKENKLSQEQKLTLILWARKIDISQVAKNILQGGMVDGEGLIKPVERWDKKIGKYIKPIFLEIGAHGYGLKKEFNDDNEVQLFLYEMPKDIVNGSPEEFNNYVSVEEGTLTVKYEPEEVINFMYNEIYCEAQSIILNCLDDIYHKCNLERNQVERINKDNIIEVKPAMDANGQPYITELSSTAKENLYADYGTTAGSNVAIVPPGIESKILGGNNYQSDYTRQTEIFRNNILRTFVTPQSQAGNEKSNQNVAEYINDSAITGFIVNVANDQKWVLKYCNELLNRQLELMGINETLDFYFSYSRDDVLRYIMELSSEGDEIYKNYLSNFEEEQPVGERILNDNGVEI
ncbi:MAG: hypothetical protein MR875_05475 [Methanobrevibacter sp.]|nr:hypothetical protein [Methanobrevibacter sp.]